MNQLNQHKQTIEIIISPSNVQEITVNLFISRGSNSLNCGTAVEVVFDICGCQYCFFGDIDISVILIFW